MKKAFTLTETLIALGAIGVIALIVIPVVINTGKDEALRAGVKKAVQTVNDAISLNIASGEHSAYHTNSDNTLFEYLQKNIDVISSTTISRRNSDYKEFQTRSNIIFEFPKEKSTVGDLTIKTYECGTNGLDTIGSSKAKTADPCVIVADVNGRKKPDELSDDDSLRDKILIIVTDKDAFPYGEAAQKAYYSED